jgi:hypothetical protein
MSLPRPSTRTVSRTASRVLPTTDRTASRTYFGRLLLSVHFLFRLLKKGHHELDDTREWRTSIKSTVQSQALLVEYLDFSKTK